MPALARENVGRGLGVLGASRLRGEEDARLRVLPLAISLFGLGPGMVLFVVAFGAMWPVLLATVVTLELCVVFDLPLNFANVIALPLLLGVGVAFKIYYIMAWRRGRTALVQSTLTRAVIFSAMTTATAFGSLWLSSHPGTSSMGKLMALALVCTMAAAVLFQPALMGPPRQARRDDEDEQPEPAELWDVQPAGRPASAGAQTPGSRPAPVGSHPQKLKAS